MASPVGAWTIPAIPSRLPKSALTGPLPFPVATPYEDRTDWVRLGDRTPAPRMCQSRNGLNGPKFPPDYRMLVRS